MPMPTATARVRTRGLKVGKFDPNGLARTAAGVFLPPGVPPPRETASRKQLWTATFAQSIPKIADHLVLGGITMGTDKKYRAAMKQWTDFIGNMNDDGGFGYPTMLTGDDPQRDEKQLLQFIAYEGWLMGNKASTVKGKLSGIRWHHVHAGLRNPLDDKYRIGQSIKSLKRLRGDSTGKLPVTPQMLRHLRRCLDLSLERHAAIWLGATLGFFLMMRCSEYLAEGSLFDAARALTTDKVLAQHDDVPLEPEDFERATSLTALFEASKTDQNRVGCTRTVYETGDDLCPIEAYKTLRRLRGGANWTEKQPLMMDSDGWVMNRAFMSALLKGVGLDCGIPESEVATHSLRIGGATAMAATGEYTDDEIRRFGRWKSDCWRRYVYAARSAVRGLAAAMSRVRVATEATASAFRAASTSSAH